MTEDLEEKINSDNGCLGCLAIPVLGVAGFVLGAITCNNKYSYIVPDFKEKFVEYSTYGSIIGATTGLIITIAVYNMTKEK